MIIVIEALKNSLLMLPLITVVYLIVEILSKNFIVNSKTCKLFTVRWSPLTAAALGLVPRNYFAGLAEELYFDKKTSLGAFIAVFMATSEDALPVLLGNYNASLNILPLIGVKLFVAVFMGFLINLITYEYQNKNYREYIKQQETILLSESKKEYNSVKTNASTACFDNEESGFSMREKTGGSIFKEYLAAPILHSILIFIIVFLTNLGYNFLINAIGEAVYQSFMSSTVLFQPFIAGLIALIPFWPITVFLTQLYVLGGISSGALLTALLMNSSIILYKFYRKSDNKNGTVILCAVVFIVSILFGMLFNALGL